MPREKLSREIYPEHLSKKLDVQEAEKNKVFKWLEEIKNIFKDDVHLWAGLEGKEVELKKDEKGQLRLIIGGKDIMSLKTKDIIHKDKQNFFNKTGQEPPAVLQGSEVESERAVELVKGLLTQIKKPTAPWFHLREKKGNDFKTTLVAERGPGLYDKRPQKGIKAETSGNMLYNMSLDGLQPGDKWSRSEIGSQSYDEMVFKRTNDKGEEERLGRWVTKDFDFALEQYGYKRNRGKHSAGNDPSFWEEGTIEEMPELKEKS